MSQTFFSRAWSSVKSFPGLLVRSRITLIVTVLVVLAAGFLGWRYLGTKKQAGGGYTTTTAADGNIQEIVSASGNLIADQSVALTFKSQGYVETCNVQLGDLVKAGQVLATEDTSDLQASLDQVESTLDSAEANYNKLVSTDSQEIGQAQAQVDQTNTALSDAKSTLDRDQQLLGAGGVSQSTVDSDNNAYQQALTSYKSAELTLAQDQTHADVAAAAAAVKSAQSQVEQAQDNLTDASIVAPFDGYIDTISGNPGMWTGGGAVASGTSTATQFEIILTSTNLLIDADVNEADISKVSVGQAVTFTVDTYPNETFTGKLIALSPNATTVSNVQEYEAHISIDDYSKLKSGLPATITIITDSANNVILIPQSALTYSRTYLASLAKGSGSKRQSHQGASASAGGAGTGQGSAGYSQGGSKSSQGGASTSQTRGMVVVLVNGKPQIKRVQTGLTDGVNVQITSGLNVGDIVVTGSATPAKTSGSTAASSQTSGQTSGQRQGGGGGGGAGGGLGAIHL
jgi:HlyD family secretion protein